MAVTVTAAQTAHPFNGILLRVRVLTGAAATQNGGTASTTAAYNASLTTTAAGSVVYGAMDAGGSTFTAEPSCTIVDNVLDTVNSEQYGTFRTTSATGTPGAVTVGSALAYNGLGGMAAAEILQAAGQTLAEDASSPAAAEDNNATTVTTASFTPPAGSLLVAMVASDGDGAGVTTVAVSDSSGLTWTELAKANAGNQEYAGVWVARVSSGTTVSSSDAAAAAESGPVIRVTSADSAGAAERELRAWPASADAASAAEAGSAGPAGTTPSDSDTAHAAEPSGTVTAHLSAAETAAVTETAATTRYITGSALSGDGTSSWFTDQAGNPRLLVCEDVWNITWYGGKWGTWQAVYDTYLAQRAAQGYTAVEVSVFSYPYAGLNPPGSPADGSDWDGTYPFATTTNPSTGFNAAFWARRDYFFASAAAKGITVVANASTPLLEDATDMCTQWTTAQWTAYGTALGTRYKNTPNILWIVGDDYFGTVDTGLSAWLTALRAAGDTHLVSIQNAQETTSRFAFNPAHAADPNSFDVNSQYDWVYTYNPSYNGVIYAQQHEPGASDVVQAQVPAVWGDGFYLNSSVDAGQTDLRLERQNIWWALSSGACGFSTGDNNIWPWDSGAPALITGTTPAQTAFCTQVVPAIVTAFSALPGWHKLVADWGSQLVTAGRGTPIADTSAGSNGYTGNTDAYVTASRVPDGSLAVIYCAKAFSITINQAKMAAGYTVTWVDPVTGAASAGTPGATYNSATAKGSNSAGDPDWVLVLQGPAGGASPSDSDAGHGTDAAGTVTAHLSSADAGHGTDAGEFVLTGGGTHVTDTDAVHAEDSGFSVLSDNDPLPGTDAGETVRVASAETAGAAERELRAWPGSADTASAAESQYWSGPLADADTAHGTGAAERVRVADSGVFPRGDSALVADTSLVVEIYAFQPPFRWTGGGFELVWHAAAGPGGYTGITVWRGPRPDRAVYKLYSALAASDEVRLVYDADWCEAAAQADPALVSASVTVAPAVVLAVWVTGWQ